MPASKNTFKVLMPIPSDWDTGQARQLYYGQLIPAIRREIEASGGALVLHALRHSGNSTDKEAIRRIIKGDIPDAIIVTRLSDKSNVVDYLQTEGVPFVVFGHDDTTEYPWVDADNYGALRFATEQAISAGHSNIALLNGPSEMSYAQFRQAGFCDAMKHAGLTIDERKILHGEPITAQGMSMAAHLFQQVNPPTCLICATDELALGAASTLEQYGLEVGKDISITGYGHTPSAEQHSPTIATFEIPYELLGTTLGETASRLALGKPVSLNNLMPVTWRNGESLQPISPLGNRHIDYDRDPFVLELESSLRRFKRVQVISSIGSWRWSQVDQSFRFSSEIRQMLGLDQTESIHWDTFLALLSRQNRDQFRQAWTSALDGFGLDTRIEIDVLGIRFYIRWLGDFVLDGLGNLVVAEGSAQDITDIVQLEQQLREAQQEATLANEFKSSLLNNVTHELRTPLHAVLGLTSRLSSMGVSQEQQVLIDRVVRSGNQLSQTIDDLLLISKAETQPVIIEHQPFDLRAVFERLEGIAHGLLIGQSIEWRMVQPDPRICLLKGDAFRLLQIMTNLVGNAAKFTHQGVIELSAVAKELTDNGSDVLIELSVKDTGIGIQEEYKHQLFEVFRQADSSVARSYGGAGLGLSIVKYLVDLMGGHVNVQSQQGVGSVFSVTLPFERSSYDIPLSPQNDPTDDTKDSLMGFRVLIVDDSEINLELAKGMAEDLGVTVDIALSGRAALDQLDTMSGTYDVILMDLQVPEMDGFETTQRIHQHTNGSNTPVLAVSADVTDEQYDKALSVGMVGFLGKPFSHHQLAASLKSVLNQQALSFTNK